VLGTLLNIAAITAGTGVGLMSRSRIPAKSRDTVLAAMGAVTLVYGVSLGLKSANLLVPLGGLVLGTIIGELMNLQGRLESAGEKLRRRFGGKEPAANSGDPAASISGDAKSRFVDGFVAASVLFCVGPMTVLGSIEDGLGLGFKTLAIKSLLDGVASAAYSAALGIGVWFSVLTVLVIQGGITLGAGFLQPYLGEPVIAEFSACGGYMLVVIGLGLLGAIKARATNMLPGLIITALIVLLLDALGAGWRF
jgi:hypothetical protein